MVKDIFLKMNLISMLDFLILILIHNEVTAMIRIFLWALLKGNFLLKFRFISNTYGEKLFSVQNILDNLASK